MVAPGTSTKVGKAIEQSKIRDRLSTSPWSMTTPDLECCDSSLERVADDAEAEDMSIGPAVPGLVAGIDMLRTLSRMICRIVFRNALRKSAVLEYNVRHYYYEEQFFVNMFKLIRIFKRQSKPALLGVNNISRFFKV